jgi:mono/diheme cytochrome c family protein
MKRQTGFLMTAAALGMTMWAVSSALVVARAGRAEEQSAAAAVERGKYLVTAMGCNDCHTPMKLGPNGPEPDMTKMLAGHPGGPLPAPSAPGGPWLGAFSATFTAWAGPWGISYTANLTPDKETGLGTWTEQQFIDTIRNGRRQGRGRELLPPMPWPMIRHLTDDDLKAVFAYLRSIPAITNKVPDPVIAGAPPA